MTISPPDLSRATAGSDGGWGLVGSPVSRRKSFISRDRDLFAGGERDAVRCKRATIFLPEEDLIESPPSLQEQMRTAAKARRSSVQDAPPLPPMSPANAAAFTKRRRNSEQAASTSFLPSSTASAPVDSHPSRLLSPGSAIELLASPPSFRSAPLFAAPKRSAPTSVPLRTRALSATSTSSATSSHNSQPSSGSHGRTNRIKRKPVPTLSLEDPAELESVSDPLWDGSTPLSEVSSTDTNYGFPHLITAVSPSSVTPSPAASMALDDPLGSIEEKVRRMSLETSATGLAGLGLGLDMALAPRRGSGATEEEQGEVEERLQTGLTTRRGKTLAEVKAEKLAARRRTEEKLRGVVVPSVDARRRTTEGSLAVAVPNCAFSSPFRLLLSILTFLDDADHLGISPTLIPAPVSPASVVTDTVSMSRSITAATAASPASSLSPRRTFRPFALVKQNTARPFVAPSSGKDDVDAWMDVMFGHDEADENNAPRHLPFAFSTASSRPRTEHLEACSPRTTSPAPVERSRPTSYVPYRPEDFASLANSLPELVYSPKPSECDVVEEETTGVVAEDFAMEEEEGSTEGSEEFVDASEGRHSFDSPHSPTETEQDVFSTSSSAPPLAVVGTAFSFAPADNTRLVNLTIPPLRGLNKRSASTSGIADLSPHVTSTTATDSSRQRTFSSTPASPKLDFSFSFSHRNSTFALLAPKPASSTTSVASPPFSQPAKRQHLSSPTSPPLHTPSPQLSLSRTAIGKPDKPLPPRPPKNAARRSLVFGQGREGGKGAASRPNAGEGAKRERDGSVGAGELENCPVLLGRVASISSTSSSSEGESIEGLKVQLSRVVLLSSDY